VQQGALIMIVDQELFDIAGVWTDINCICDYCDTKFVRSKRNLIVGRKILLKESCNSKDCVSQKRRESQLLKYGVGNAGGTKESLEKAKTTWLKNLGVDNPFKSETVKNKIKETCLEKYGKTSFLATQSCRESLESYQQTHTEEIRAKIESTCIEKYGVSHPRKSAAYMDKFCNDFFVQHGVYYPSQMADHLEKRQATCLTKYGFDHPVKNLEVQEKIRQTCLEKYGKYPVNCHGKTESEIKQFIEELGFACNSDRLMLNGKEVDIYIPNKQIAIEYCGLYWHNEMSPCPRDRKYHFDKYRLLQKQGIRLITIFEDEWLERESVCRSILSSILGVYPQRLYARKCSVSELDPMTAKTFLNANHLQGSSKFQHACGLSYEDKIVAVGAYGKHHRQNQEGIVISRFCTSRDTQIVGGISKLLKFIRGKISNERLITWSDNRWSVGDIYKTLGFKLEAELPPDYSYYKYGSHGKRQSKQSMQKSQTGCPKEVTERDWCLENGYVRIWDCGKKRWTMS